VAGSTVSGDDVTSKGAEAAGGEAVDPGADGSGTTRSPAAIVAAAVVVVDDPGFATALGDCAKAVRGSHALEPAKIATAITFGRRENKTIGGAFYHNLPREGHRAIAFA